MTRLKDASEQGEIPLLRSRTEIVKADFEPIITKSLPSSAQTLASQVRN